jgi:hypothetical protein
MTSIKVGIKINLEMKPVIISANTIHKRILRMNFYEVDKIKTLDYINSVIAYDNDLTHISLIIKFCKVTKKPLKIYTNNELSDKIIQKLQNYKINYKLFNIFF